MHHKISKLLETHVYDEVKSRMYLKGQGQNEKPCIIGFPSYWAHMFTMMWWLWQKWKQILQKWRLSLLSLSPLYELFDAYAANDFVISVLKFDVLSARIICLVNFSIRSKQKLTFLWFHMFCPLLTTLLYIINVHIPKEVLKYQSTKLALFKRYSV